MKTLKLVQRDLYINEIHRMEYVSKTEESASDDIEKDTQDLTVLFQSFKGTDFFSLNFGLDVLDIVAHQRELGYVDLEFQRALDTFPRNFSLDSLKIGKPDQFRQSIVTAVISGLEIEVKI